MTPGNEDHDRRSQDEILAGEYVLGVLSLEARRDVERRMAADRGFSQLVERWQTDFAPFDEDYKDAAPNAAVFGKIEQRLFGEPPSTASSRNLWNAIGFWRWLSLGTGVAAVAASCAAVYLLGAANPSRDGAGLVAELSSPNNGVNLLASYDPASGRVRLVPVVSDRPRQKSLQLWLVPGSGNPQSLGVFQPGSDGELVIPENLRGNMASGAVFAISVEPFGGSPTGLPTGPVIASGTARQL